MGAIMFYSDDINDCELDLDSNIESSTITLFVEGSEILLNECRLIVPKNIKKM